MIGRVVYIFSCEVTGLVTIGVANDVTRRVEVLQEACGCRLDIFHVSLPLVNYKAVLDLFCNSLKDKRTYGDWYDIKPDFALLKLNKLEKRFKIDPVMKYFYKGDSYSELAKRFKVSKPAISMQFKKWHLVKKPDSVKTTNTKTAIPPILKTPAIGFTERLLPNIYKHKSEEKYLLKIYKNGSFEERVFDSFEEAKSHLPDKK